MRSSEARVSRLFAPRFGRRRRMRFALERWVGTLRCDCLNSILITSRPQLERILRVYVDHYISHRSHRALTLTPLIRERRLRLVSSRPPGHVQRRDFLGGLSHHIKPPDDRPPDEFANRTVLRPPEHRIVVRTASPACRGRRFVLRRRRVRAGARRSRRRSRRLRVGRRNTARGDESRPG
jgi:hypothetical protein